MKRKLIVLTNVAAFVTMLVVSLAVGHDAAQGQADPPPTPIIPPSSGTFLYLRGDEGDYILGGGERLLPADDFWVVRSSSTWFEALVNGPFGLWSVDFAAPGGLSLGPGTYDGAARYPFQDPDQPGLDVGGEGRGCNTLSGSFVVNEAIWDDDGSMVIFDATFEQHCEGDPAALHGEIRYEAVPTSMRTPDPRPACGSFLYIDSDPRDYVGGGEKTLFTLDNASFTATYNDYGNFAFRSIIDSVALDERWRVDMQAPSGQPLTVGIYDNAMRYPFQAPGHPGLSVSGHYHGCNTLTGRFIVNEAVWGPGNDVIKFDATFEQHCEGVLAALYGEVRIDNETVCEVATPTATPTPSRTPTPVSTAAPSPTPTSTSHLGVGGYVQLPAAALAPEPAKDNELTKMMGGKLAIGVCLALLAVAATSAWKFRARRSR